MPTATATILVNAPVEEVFDFVADYRNIPRLQPQFSVAKLAGEPLLCLGDDFPATDLKVA